MKKGKILFILPLLLLISCGKKTPIFLFGSFNDNLIHLIEQELSDDTQSVFTSSTMVSNELYKIADTRSIAVKDNHRYAFDKQIRSSGDIVISIGFNDFLPYITINPNQHIFDYDEEQVPKQMELLQYNVYHTLEEIRELNAKANIYVVGAFAFYPFETPEQKLFSSFLFEITTVLQVSCQDHNVRFISVDACLNESEIARTIARYVS